MKHAYLAVLAIFVASTAHADKTYTLQRLGWDLYRSNTLQSSGWPDEQSCVADALARVTAVGTNAEYNCRQRTNLSITVTSTAPPTINLTASPQSVSSGSASSLNWSSANATGCVASGGWSGSRATSGTQSTGPLTVSTAYNLTCNGPGGTANAAVTVGVTASGSGQYGLEWPGTGTVRRMLYWSNPLPMYDATYIFTSLAQGTEEQRCWRELLDNLFLGQQRRLRLGAHCWVGMKQLLRCTPIPLRGQRLDQRPELGTVYQLQRPTVSSPPTVARRCSGIVGSPRPSERGRTRRTTATATTSTSICRTRAR